MRRATSLNSMGGFGPPPPTPNRTGAGVRSSDIGASAGQRGVSPGGRAGIGSRQHTPASGPGLSGAGGSGYYRNSSEGVSAVLGGTTSGSSYASSPSRPSNVSNTRPSTQGLPSRTVGTPKTSVGGGSSLTRANTTGGGGFRGAGGGGISGTGLGAGLLSSSEETPHFDCKVMQSGGKSVNQPLQLCAGWGETQGMRPTMEDAHLALINAGTASDGHPVSLFAVLDGHCGRRVADLGAHFLPEVLLSRPSLGTDNAAAFAEAVVMTDKAIFQQQGRADGGSTLIAGLIHNRMLFVANLGDARAVLYDGNSTIAMSVDHKPTDQAEQQRIIRCGSFVHFGRVGACLAVSRALGDYEFKFNGGRYGTEKEFAVGHVPDIRQINLTDSSKFLLLACDGLWDVVSNEEATAFVNSFMTSADTRDLEKTLNLCSAQLAMHAVERGSMDNVTCLIVWFHAPGGGATTGSSMTPVASTTTTTSTNGATSSSVGAPTSPAVGSAHATTAATGTGASTGIGGGRMGARPATQGTPGYRTQSSGAYGAGVGRSSGYTANNTSNTRLPSLGGGGLRRGNL